jgi:hypothetical protein
MIILFATLLFLSTGIKSDTRCYLPEVVHNFTNGLTSWDYAAYSDSTEFGGGTPTEFENEGSLNCGRFIGWGYDLEGHVNNGFFYHHNCTNSTDLHTLEILMNIRNDTTGLDWKFQFYNQIFEGHGNNINVTEILPTNTDIAEMYAWIACHAQKTGNCSALPEITTVDHQYLDVIDGNIHYVTNDSVLFTITMSYNAAGVGAVIFYVNGVRVFGRTDLIVMHNAMLNDHFWFSVHRTLNDNEDIHKVVGHSLVLTADEIAARALDLPTNLVGSICRTYRNRLQTRVTVWIVIGCIALGVVAILIGVIGFMLVRMFNTSPFKYGKMRKG